MDRHQAARAVLYVEDHPASARALADVVALRPNWTFIHERTVRSGIEAVIARQPDLVVLDLNLPDGHGLEVLAALKDDCATTATPVYVLTAGTSEGLAERVVAAGAEQCWTKPLDLRRFLAVLDEQNDRPTAAGDGTDGA